MRIESIFARVLAIRIILAGTHTIDATFHPVQCDFRRDTDYSVVLLVAVTHPISIENGQLNKIDGNGNHTIRIQVVQDFF